MKRNIKEKNSNWVGLSKGNSTGTRLFIWVISRVGIIPAYFILLFAAAQYTLIDKKTRAILQEFRNVIGLTCGIKEVYYHFYSFGMSLIDRYAYLLTGKQFFTFDTKNEDVIEKELKAGKGVILLGAHLGNWELAGKLLQGRLNAKVNFLMYDGESSAVKAAVRKATDNRQANVIFVGNDNVDTSVALVNALQNGEIVCLNGDRVLEDQRYADVSFMGRSVKFPAGPFIISAVTGAPVIPIFAVKTSLKHYSFFAYKPIMSDLCSRHERMTRINSAVESYAAILESVVRKYPYQWFNYYHFWGDIKNRSK